MSKAAPWYFKLALALILLTAVGAGFLLFADSDGSSEIPSLALASDKTKPSQRSVQEGMAEKNRDDQRSGNAEDAASANGASTGANRESELDQRRPFNATDPSTWNDILDAAKIPEGFNAKDPKTWPLLEQAYNEELARRRGSRSASGSRSNGSHASNHTSKHSDDESGNQADGTLEVLIVDKAGTPIPNIAVYPPLTRNLELAGGQVAFVGDELARAVKSDAEGKAIFGPEQIGFTTEKSWPAEARVVVQDNAYATVVRDLKTSDLQRRENHLQVELVPAVFVEVKVVDRDGNAVPNALVSMKQGEGRYAEMQEAFSASADVYGQFNLKVARDYRYIFNVSAKDFVPATTRAFDFVRDEHIVSVTLQAGRGVEGYIYDGGSAVAGASVRSETDNVTAISDDNGYFVLASLKDQIYSNRLRVRVTKAGHAPVVRQILVNEQNLQIDLPKEGTISGFVLRAENPVAGATVTATLVQEKKGYKLAGVVTGEDGSFTLQGVGEGQVSIGASANGGFSPPHGMAGKAAQEQDGVNLKLGEGGSVLGTLRATFAGGGEGVLGGAAILVDGEVATAVDGDGTFRLTGLAAGNHQISVTGTASVPAHLMPFNVLAMSGEPVRYFTLPAAHKINSKLGEEVKVDLQVVEFVERTHREISIRFELDTSEDIPGIEVLLTPSVAAAPNGHKTAPIRFAFSLTGGSYTQEKVSLLEDVSYSATVLHPRVHRKVLSSEDLASVPHEGVLVVNLERARSYRAYVKDSSGNAVVDVGARVNGIKGAKGSGNTQSDQHGYIEIGGLDVGTYSLVLFKNSYYELRQEVKLTDQDGEVPTLTLLGANEIRVCVIDSSGVPQPGSRVWAIRPRNNDPKSSMQYFNLGETDGEGRKVVNFHWIRHYQVTAIKGNSVAAVNFDNLKDTPVREFDITLEPYQIISGTVRSRETREAVGNVDVFASLESGSAAATANRYYTRTKSNGTFSIYAPLGVHSLVVRETRIYLETVNPGIHAGSKGIEIFSDPKDEVEGNWAEVIGFSAPSNLKAGQKFSASITVKNKGTTNWNSNSNYRLGSYSPRDTKRWGPTRVELFGEVSSGQSYTFTVELAAPNKAGTYNMQWRMVQDGREWFGTASAILKVKVSAADPPPTE